MAQRFLGTVRRITSLEWLDRSDDGQGMAEYGLILAGVAIIAIIAVFLLGGNIGNLLNRISSSLGS